MMTTRALFLTILSSFILSLPGYAPAFSQQVTPHEPLPTAQAAADDSVTAEDYQHAEQFLGQNTYQKVMGDVSGQHWSDDRLVYSTRTQDGVQYMLADPSSGEKKAAFDHQKLANSLGDLTDMDFDENQLSLRSVEVSEDGRTLRFQLRGHRYETDLASYKTKEMDEDSTSFREFVSPDGKKAAYIDDYNLWVRNIKTGEATQLTFDGKENYGYATNNAGWVRSDRPVLKWSPQSDKIATFQHDSRGVGEMYLYNTKVGHSDLEKWKYPLPGDSTVFKIERVVVHLGDEPEVVRLDMDPDFHRSTISDHVADWDGTFLDVQWSADGEQLAFISSSRNHQRAQLRMADPNTGEVRDVMKEKNDTYYESGFSKSSWRVLEDSDEVIWFSERSNWGHLYLYDLQTGELKNQITEGDWRVLDLEYVDEENRTIYFTGSNREEGNPYYHYLYKINMDGSGLTNLTPEQKNHDITWSDSKKYFTDTYSTPTEPPTSVIRDTDGDVVMELEEAEISPLKEMGWQPPTPFMVKARDGETDLYGLMFTPTDFDSTKSYPVVNYLYPGPQSGSIRGWGFSPARGDHQALAELGFIVVALDAMGTPGRSKSFHDKWYGDMHDNGVPDQVAAIRQLAERYPAMDTTRVGIWGHSGGGFASTAAILSYPDFYKVAVSESGNHDNRNYESDWGDKYQGLLKKDKNVDKSKLQRYTWGDNYDSQANQLHVENLKGDLLLAHGLMDDNVPPTNTLLVADALIRANKEFDMFLIPNARHGYGYAGSYFRNKRWDYFVEHLMGVNPPANAALDMK